MLNNNICHIVSKGISAGEKVFKYIPLVFLNKNCLIMVNMIMVMVNSLPRESKFISVGLTSQ